jgi:N-methylhydantoinase A
VAAKQLKAEGVQAVAVCLLHSYVNSDHEKRVGEILKEIFPEAIVSLSAEVAPEFREYYRASTTVINASISPLVSRYLKSIQTELRRIGLTGDLLIMQSSGGVYTADAAREKPVFMVESGPAAGVIAAAQLGAILGYPDMISLDMGGTTAKACLIRNGTPRVTKDYEVGAKAAPGTGSGRGSGYPIRTPVIDLVEIGAGGGSIAWVDPGGILRVGPQSAGAEPGPVCYGKGGTEPTITDANLLLGRLNPDYFLGGGIKLDVDGARRAIEERCARPLGIDPVEAANGIVEIANTAMMNALRLVSVQHGFDPRDFVLVAFGGAGPAHANRLAAEMEITTTVIPVGPGITCAWGLLATDLKRDYSISMVRRVDATDPAALESAYKGLEAQGAADLQKEGVKPDDLSFLRQMDMRYFGQSYELTVEVPNSQLTREHLDAVAKQFDAEHDRNYGFSAPGEPTQFVTLRLAAIGRIPKPQLRLLPKANGHSVSAMKETREVYFAERRGYVATPVYDRYQLGPGVSIDGPAIFEEFDSTTVLHPDYKALVDPHGILLMTKK